MYNNGRYLTGESELPKINEHVLAGHSGTIRTLCFHPLDENILVSGCIVDGEIRV